MFLQCYFLCHVLKVIIFTKLDLKLPKLLLQKIAKSLSAGAFPLNPRIPSGGWGLSPHTRKYSPHIANFWLCTWLVVSTRDTNAFHQIFLSVTTHKYRYIYKKVGA